MYLYLIDLNPAANNFDRWNRTEQLIFTNLIVMAEYKKSDFLPGLVGILVYKDIIYEYGWLKECNLNLLCNMECVYIVWHLNTIPILL